jgi:FkbM family methyltransferase
MTAFPFPFGFFKTMIVAGKSGKNLPEKISILRTFLSLKFKKNFSSKPEKSEYTVKILDYKVTGYDYSTMQNLFTEIFLSAPYFFNSRSDKPVIVDGGSNIGFSVLYFKKLFPGSVIYAFEANPYAFALLQKNVRQNNLSDVTMYNSVIADKKGETSFYIDNNWGTIHGSIRKEIGGATELKVQSILLSEFIASLQVKIELVKLDVEGSEHHIVSDLFDSSVLSLPNQYIIEYHHKPNGGKSALADFLRKFEACGYEYNIKSITPVKNIGEYQDFMIHFYR